MQYKVVAGLLVLLLLSSKAVAQNIQCYRQRQTSSICQGNPFPGRVGTVEACCGVGGLGGLSYLDFGTAVCANCPVDCGTPPTASPNGAVSAPTTTAGSEATYTCNSGYNLVGSAMLTCLADGTWSGNAPTCNPVDCGTPPTASPNGAVSAPTTTFESEATYTCNSGYNLVGSAMLTCLAGGTWSGNAPTCDPVDCGAPPAEPPNGAVSAPTTTFGSEATYTCNSGYNLVGSAMLTCLADGTWSGSAPTCDPVDCGSPPSASPNGAVSAPTTIFRSVATYTCNRGYNLVGDAMLTCLADGMWSGSAPACDIVVCGPPPFASTNGALLVTTITFRSEATYTCNRGYNLVGSAMLTCVADGTWSGSAPTCNPVDCGPPPSASPNGAVSASTTIFRSLATYTCNSGYNLVGDAMLICLPNGTWSGSAPTCDRVPEEESSKSRSKNRSRNLTKNRGKSRNKDHRKSHSKTSRKNT